MLADVTTKIKPTFPFLLVGVLAGLSMIIFLGFPLEWVLYCFMALFFLAVSFLLKDKKRYFEFLLIITLSIARPFLIGEPFTWHFGGAQPVPELFMSDIWLVALLTLWFTNLFKPKYKVTFDIQYLDVAAFLFISWTIVSVIHAKNYALGFYEVIRLLRQILLYFYISRNVKTEDDLKHIVFCLFMALLFQGLLAVFQYLGGQMPFGFFQNTMSEEDTTGAFRVGSTLNGPSQLSQYFELLAPLALAFTFYQKDNKYKLLFLALFSLGTVGIIFTFARAAIVSLGFAVFIILMLYLLSMPRGEMRKEKESFILQTVLIVAAVYIIFTLLEDEIMLRFVADDGGSADSRYPMMLVALTMIRQNPIFGIGLNNFNEIMSYYDMYVFLPNPAYAVHNVYLFFASEIGLPGLFILFVVFALVYKKVYNILKLDRGLLKSVTIGLIAAITSYLFLHANATLGFKYMVTIGSTLWLHFGLIVAMEKIVRQKQLPQTGANAKI